MNLIRNIKKFLLPREKGELYYSLKKILGCSPHNLELYRQALLHKSMLVTDEEGHHINNERLEFLGDAIIEAVVSNYLFRKYGNEQEGFLTTARSKMVRRSTLGKLSQKIGIDDLVRSSISMEAHNSYIGGNAFEALFGALYLDRGYRRCQRFFISLIERGFIDTERTVKREQNFKSHLLEWGQKYHYEIQFMSHEDDVEDSHKAPFYTEVWVEDLCLGRGRGYSKKESHQQASRRVLQKLREHPHLAGFVFQSRLQRLAISDIKKTSEALEIED
jgi:ribonuclease-3